MTFVKVAPPGWVIVPILAYSCFCVWMFCACVYQEDDRDERVAWALMLFLVGAVTAPFYYWKRYRPRRAGRLRN